MDQAPLFGPDDPVLTLAQIVAPTGLTRQVVRAWQKARWLDPGQGDTARLPSRGRGELAFSVTDALGVALAAFLSREGGLTGRAACTAALAVRPLLRAIAARAGEVGAFGVRCGEDYPRFLVARGIAARREADHDPGEGEPVQIEVSAVPEDAIAPLVFGGRDGTVCTVCDLKHLIEARGVLALAVLNLKANRAELEGGSIIRPPSPIAFEQPPIGQDTAS